MDFDRGACTFCRACADACEEAVFDTDHAPWALIAVVGAGCFLAGGISCRSCTDVCEANALRFDLRAGPVGRVTVDAAACTGCGACAGICPAGAISIAEPEPLLEATP